MLTENMVPGELFSLGDFAIVLAVKDFPLRLCNSRGWMEHDFFNF